MCVYVYKGNGKGVQVAKKRNSVVRYRTRVVRRGRRGGGGRRRFTLPLAVVAGFVVPYMNNVNRLAGQGWTGAKKYEQALGAIVGYDVNGNKFTPSMIWKEAKLQYCLLGFLAHGMANRFGLNRMLGNWKIPLVRI